MLRYTRAFYRVSAQQATKELKHLLPLLSLQQPELFAEGAKAKKAVSAASLAIATAHKRSESVAHSAECPVLRQRLPLTAVAEDPNFRARPCACCVSRRVHYLASEVFAEDFEAKCRATASDKDIVSEHLEGEVKKQFGSFDKFKEELMLFATSGHTPGYTWVVCSDKGGMSILNCPPNTLPLSYGLWPVAVINVTEARLSARLLEQAQAAEAATVAAAKATPPSWSRAARNAAAAVTQVPLNEARGLTSTTLQQAREAVAAQALREMNWDFMEAQLRQATAYFSSAERTEMQAHHRNAREKAAVATALGRLRDSGTSIAAGDAVRIEGAAAEETAAAVEAKQRAEEATAAEGKEETTTPAAAAAAAATTEKAATPEVEKEQATGETATRATTTASTTAETSGPKVVQLPDGTWEYQYANGNRTWVHPDGKQVFQSAELTTTVYADGVTTLFEYPNKTTVLQRADGVVVTTYADGTSVESRND